MSTNTPDQPPVDAGALRTQVQATYRRVALEPGERYHFHTGRPLARRLGYPPEWIDDLPESAVESFAGIANPFALRRLQPGERVVDVGSGAGLDTLVAARQIGDRGHVVGVDMTDEMLAKARRNAELVDADTVELRKGLAEDLPVEDDWADTVVSNGVFNLCPDKRAVFDEALRALRPGGFLQFADIANGEEVPEGARRQIDLWTG